MREKVLIFGSNFQLATRISELIKRKYDVIQCDLSSSADVGKKEISEEFDGGLLSKLACFHGVESVIFSTESLLYIKSPAVFAGLIDEFKYLKQSSAVRLIVIDIAAPIVAHELPDSLQIRLTTRDSPYGQRLSKFRQALKGVADFVLEAHSVYSCAKDDWAPSFLHSILDGDPARGIQVLTDADPWYVSSADDLIHALELNMNSSGVANLMDKPYEGGLAAFCAMAVKRFSPWSPSPTGHMNGQQAVFESLLHKTVIPAHVGLDAFAHQSRCSVNYIYRQSPEKLFGGDSVAKFRYALGLSLAQSLPASVVDDIDMVVPVPATGRMYAQGLARGLGAPYVEAIYKTDRKRSFDIESFDIRKEFLCDRLGVMPDLMSGKNIIVVDEAIFTGATLAVVSRLLLAAGTGKVYIAIPTSEVKHSCKFNMQPKRALLSDYVRKKDLGSYFNVEDVFFQDEQVFIDAFNRKGKYCMACFTAR